MIERHGQAEPFYPILRASEFEKIQDYRHELPLDIQEQLSDADYVVHIVTPTLITPESPPSALREMRRLTRVMDSRDIGNNGPALASLVSEENENVTALRKFEAVHGRDSLEVATKLEKRFPELLATTIIALAETQGIEHETAEENTPFRQEESGRIMLLTRDKDSPLGKKFSDRLNWGWPFYGSIDATPNFISAIARYTQTQDESFLNAPYIGKDGQEYSIADAFNRSVQWLVNKLDENAEGLLEFKNTDPTGGGIAAQAWKDSAFAYLHADGSRANHNDGIASVEVQALAYDALLDSAELYTATDPEKAENLITRAMQLREQIISTFWIDDQEKGGYFALATDRDEDGVLRTLNVRSSNMGHLLNSRLLEGDDETLRYMRESTVAQLFSPELLQYSGIRTLANDEVGFRPGGYHTGSVWLWDTAYIADGLERQDFHQLAWELRARIARVVEETHAFPEFVRGNASNELETNQSEIYVWNSQYDMLHLFEQPPQEIQGWTVSAILAAKYAYPTYQEQHYQLPTNPLEQAILTQIDKVYSDSLISAASTPFVQPNPS